MKRMLFAMAAGSMAVMMIAEAQDAEVQRARDALASSAAAYRDVVALRDKLSYSVTAPGSEQETKSEEYTFGPEGAVIVKNALLQAVALDSKLYLTQNDVSDKYVVAPYDGDFGAALRRVAGNGSLFEPPPLALHSGKSIDACLDTLRFNLLEPLRIAGYRHVTGDKEQDEVRFIANNGELMLAIDSRTHFFIAVSFQVRPPGAPAGFLVRVSGTFSPQILSGPESAIDFTPGSRGAVENLADLTSTRLAVGSTAPDFELESLDGKKIALHDLRGSVVVLDFWATWCVPCWTALKETQALANWAAGDHLPVTIFAVNTLEQGPDSKERLDRVRRFWKSQGFSIPTLVDVQSKMFKAYGSPGLPSVVLISPSGTILRYHEGLLPEMLETLKRETREQISSQKRSQM
jgi:cytochrome c biogenesis protein CcmG/thiol:disulfide interchange protein DsbE